MLPDDEFTVDVKVGFDSPVLANQFATLENIKDFPTEIAAARTFVFVREIEPLLTATLIKGGDLDNAIVFYDSPLQQEQIDHIADLMHAPHVKVEEFGFINDRPLASENEPARHKLMDVLGDLALVGRPIKGRVIATRPGHALNTALSKKIRKDIKRQDIQAPVYQSLIHI